MRKSISKKKRFTIFERDGFTCQYCGLSPKHNDVTLEVDHSISVKDGGGNSLDNLITSCFDCNRGKGKSSVIIGKLDNIQELEERKNNIYERLEQIKYIKSIKKDIKGIENEIDTEKYLFVYELLEGYSDYLIVQMVKRVKTKYIKNNINLNTLEECLIITLNKFSIHNEFLCEDFIKYFYGVLKKKQNKDIEEIMNFINNL